MRSSKRQAKTRLDRSAPALLIALAVAVAAVSARADEPFENLMPDGCFVCVTVRSVPDLIEPVKASAQVRMLSEPAMQPVLDEMAAGFEEVRTQFADVLGVTPEDALGMLGGQVCLGVLPRGDRDAHFLLLADVSGNPELAATVVQNILQYERDQGTYDIVEEGFRGHTVYRIEPIVQEEEEEENADADDEIDFPWDDGPEERIENPGFITLSDGILAVASSPDRTLVEQHLVLRTGETLPTVGSSDRYRRVQPFFGKEPDLVAFMDIRGTIEEAGEETAQALGESVPLALGLGLEIGLNGTAMEGLLLAPRPREGIMRAFMPQGGTVVPPACVDADNAMLLGLHFSVPVLWEEIKASLQRDDPDQYMQMEQWLKALPVDLENDVINALGHRWFVCVPAPADTEEEAGGTPMAFMADLRDADAFGAAWKQLLTMVPPIVRVDTIDFMGVGIQQFNMAMNMPDVDVRGPQPCVAVMADKLILASGLDVAKSIIKNDSRQASPLLDDQEFQQLLDRTMDAPDVLLHVNGQVFGKMMRAQVEREAEAWEEQFGPPDDEEFGPDDIPWDVLEEYTSSTILTARWTDEGLQIKMWSPAPAAAE